MSKVYFFPADAQQSMVNALPKLYDKIAGDFAVHGKRVAIKTHFGEKGNTTFLPPAFAKKICDIVRTHGGEPELIECNTLYRGERLRTENHIKLAKAHGFDFAPVVICDDGGKNWNIASEGKHFKSIKAGAKLKDYEIMIAVTHCKGHIAAGYGGALKNIGMGLGSRAGKLEMHAKVKPIFESAKCKACGICASACPANAIVIEKYAVMDKAKCIGCATCIAVCPYGAVGIPWSGTTHEEIQERIVEYAHGITGKIKTIYFNFLLNITPQCDCVADSGPVKMQDIGILASDDVVALEQASIDMINKAYGKDFFKESNRIEVSVQPAYAEAIGMGKRAYEIVKMA
ncbi:MAG: DUF362 domain-containing protein [Candidatus Aenigmarchaeota archaeon]|nr:DUF362 domain-containing protein [Candidatus Aenigmarchaeota archaeon]